MNQPATSPDPLPDSLSLSVGSALVTHLRVTRAAAKTQTRLLTYSEQRAIADVVETVNRPVHGPTKGDDKTDLKKQINEVLTRAAKRRKAEDAAAKGAGLTSPSTGSPVPSTQATDAADPPPPDAPATENAPPAPAQFDVPPAQQKPTRSRRNQADPRSVKQRGRPGSRE